MDTKVCNKCGKEKPLTEFIYRKSENRYSNPCKECKKIYLKEYASKNAKRLKKYRDEYYLLNREHKLEYQKEYREENKEEIRNKQKKYNSSNYDKTKQYKHDYYIKNKEEILDKQKKYVEENYEERKEYRRQYFINNKSKIYEYVYSKKKNDKVFKLRAQVRNMLWESFNRKSKWKTIKGHEILGCEIDYFIEYLLKTYKDNYGYEWDGKEEVHIDHIIPLSTAKTEEEIIKLCHYTNLQLLKAEDNRKKSDNLDWKIKNQ